MKNCISLVFCLVSAASLGASQYQVRMQKAREKITPIIPFSVEALNFIALAEQQQTKHDQQFAQAVVDSDAAAAYNALQRGANPHAIEATSGLPWWINLFYFFSESQRNSVLPFIIIAATVTASNDEGKTILMHAAEHDNDELARLVLSYGVDVNQADATGCTALWFAVYRRSHKVLLTLLLHPHLDRTVTDGMDRTALEWAACRVKNDPVILMLLAHVAGQEEKDKALQCACTHANQEAIKVLIGLGAKDLPDPEPHRKSPESNTSSERSDSFPLREWSFSQSSGESLTPELPSTFDTSFILGTALHENSQS